MHSSRSDRPRKQKLPVWWNSSEWTLDQLAMTIKVTRRTLRNYAASDRLFPAFVRREGIGGRVVLDGAECRTWVGAR